MARNILILGASYGSLLATKLLMAGHNVSLVCRSKTAELINRDLNERLCVIHIAYVGLDRVGFTTCCLNCRYDFVGCLGTGVIVHDHCRAALCQFQCDPPPDAPSSTCHYRNFI